jgi:hypothetical protein
MINPLKPGAHLKIQFLPHRKQCLSKYSYWKFKDVVHIVTTGLQGVKYTKNKLVSNELERLWKKAIVAY